MMCSTTVFGIDDSSHFSSSGEIICSPDTSTASPKKSNTSPSTRYRTCKPRPIPACLDMLLRFTEVFTNSTYNFCLINYYASGTDSISYHSDDERFLGPDPCIASLSLGAKRDFLMRHKKQSDEAASGGGMGAVNDEHIEEATQASSRANGTARGKEKPSDIPSLKLALGSGDMVVMRGRTQACWLHSIPKRKGPEADKGRINITFRKALGRGGTENYYYYNVGNGGVWRWDESKKEMRPWAATKESSLEEAPQKEQGDGAQ